MRVFLVLLFVVSAVLAGKEVPTVEKAVPKTKAAVVAPAVSALEEESAKDEKPAAKKPAAKKPAAKKPAAKKPAAKKPAAKKPAAKKPAAKKPAAKKAAKKSAKKSAPKKSVEAVEGKKIVAQIVKSSKKIEEENKKRQHKVNPFKVGCYSAVASNLITIGFIILIAVIWYFGCIRHGRCCCMCCYNKQGRCCCACSCCDGYIAPEDEEMVISRGDKPEYDSIEKTA